LQITSNCSLIIACVFKAGNLLRVIMLIPQEHIQLKLMDIAKERIFDTSKSVGEIAYELGFKHPQHFTRMFKKEVGMSPSDYRVLN